MQVSFPLTSSWRKDAELLNIFRRLACALGVAVEPVANAHARHLKACARKAGVKKPVPAQGFDGKSANRPLVL